MQLWIEIFMEKSNRARRKDIEDFIESKIREVYKKRAKEKIKKLINPRMSKIGVTE